jgi:hypothetical protein
LRNSAKLDDAAFQSKRDGRCELTGRQITCAGLQSAILPRPRGPWNGFSTTAEHRGTRPVTARDRVGEIVWDQQTSVATLPVNSCISHMQSRHSVDASVFKAMTCDSPQQMAGPDFLPHMRKCELPRLQEFSFPGTEASAHRVLEGANASCSLMTAATMH